MNASSSFHIPPHLGLTCYRIYKQVQSSMNGDNLPVKCNTFPLLPASTKDLCLPTRGIVAMRQVTTSMSVQKALNYCFILSHSPPSLPSIHYPTRGFFSKRWITESTCICRNLWTVWSVVRQVSPRACGMTDCRLPTSRTDWLAAPKLDESRTG